MVRRTRHLTAKHKSVRLKRDPVYFSRAIQTLFNTFVKKGKKARSRQQVETAFEHIRYTLRRPGMGRTFPLVLKELELPFTLLVIRQAKKLVDVPGALEFLKQGSATIQTYYKAVRARAERTLAERIYQELSALLFNRARSTTLKNQNDRRAKIAEAAAHEFRDWRS